MVKQRFNREFKLAVLQDLESGKTTTEIGRERQIQTGLIRRWKLEYKRDPEHAFSGKGNPSKEDARVAQLERTIGQLYLEVAFLKKALTTLQLRLVEPKKGA